MLVVSDSSPLNFLIRMGFIDVLPCLFSEVVIPPKVEQELSQPSTPESVRFFLSKRPGWLRVQQPTSIEPIAHLDPGEVAAIALARETGADLVLIDDGGGRRAAASRGLEVIGLLGILERAGSAGLLDFTVAVAQLPKDYRIEPTIILAALDRWEKRRPR